MGFNSGFKGLSTFVSTLHIGGRSFVRNLRTRHAVVTGAHLSWNPPPDGATARGGPWPPLQCASKPLDSLLCLSIHLNPSSSGPWTRHSATSFLVFLFVLLHTAFRTTFFFWNCGVLLSFYMTKPPYSLAFNETDDVLPLDYGFIYIWGYGVSRGLRYSNK